MFRARVFLFFVLLACLLLPTTMLPSPVNAGEAPIVPVIYLPLVKSAGLGMAFVPAGPFEMGCRIGTDPWCTEWYSGNSPQHTITLSAYLIDNYEVTNARYAACVAAGGCTAPSDQRSETRASYYSNPAYANFPVIWVNWFQADAFCRWEGKRLPTEAEWEKAARGVADIRNYPWGNTTPDCSRVNAAEYDAYPTQYIYCVGGTSVIDAKPSGDTAMVGSYPSGASPYGAMEMGGNVWEWVNDRYLANYYESSPTNDPQGPQTGGTRGMRGGSWGGVMREVAVRVSNRTGARPDSAKADVGFRCARSQ